MSQVVSSGQGVSMGEFRKGLPDRYKKGSTSPASKAPPGVPSKGLTVVHMHAPTSFPTQQICQIETRPVPYSTKKGAKKDRHLSRAKKVHREW